MKKLIAAAMLLLCCASAMAQLPSVSLRMLDGKTIDTAALNNDGKPFVISFFASWCKPCNRELSNIAEVYEEWQEETGMKLFAVSIDEGQNAQKVKPFVDNHGWEYDVILDPNSDFRRALGVPLIPHTFVIDGQGKIVMSHNGYKEGDEQEVIAKIREIVAETPKMKTQDEAIMPCCEKAGTDECCKKLEAEGKCVKAEGQECCKGDAEKCCKKAEAEGKCCKAEGQECCKK